MKLFEPGRIVHGHIHNFISAQAILSTAYPLGGGSCRESLWCIEPLSNGPRTRQDLPGALIVESLRAAIRVCASARVPSPEPILSLGEARLARKQCDI